MTTAQNLDVTVDGDRIDARLYAPESAELTTEQGYPCIVMAHGLGCTQDSGLHEFATGLATTGTAVITFDYRHFAGSEGSPRQLIDPYKQLDDYRAVISSHAQPRASIPPESSCGVCRSQADMSSSSPPRTALSLG